MKKITACILAALFILVSVPCMAETTQDFPKAEIELDFFQVTATYKTDKNCGDLTARVTNATDTTDRKVYAADQKKGEQTEDGFVYTFRFRMPQTAKSGEYLFSVGGAVSFSQTFSYYNIMEKVDFYNALHEAPVASETDKTIYQLLSGEDCKVSYDFTLYCGLEESVRALIDEEVDTLDLSATRENVSEKEALLKQTLDELIPLAVLLNVNEDTDEETLDELVKIGSGADVLDDTGYENLPYEYVLKYLLQEKPDTLEQASVSKAFSSAVLLATVEALDAYSIAELFDYYLEKGLVSVDMDDYEDICDLKAEEDLFAVVKKKTNSDISKLEKNVNEAMKNMLEEDDEEESSGGGSSSGGSSKPSGGGGGGGGGGYRPATGGAGISGDAQNAEPKKEEKETVSFDDLSSVPWATEAVTYLATEGVLSGRGAGVFAPDDIVTREELVKMIVLAFDAYDENAKASFTDVSEDRWSYAYIASAYQLELVSGVSETEFAPQNAVTRQDMATILYRILQKTGDAKKGNLPYSDEADISDYAKDAVASLTAIGAISGMGDGTFAPKNNVTRAQAAKVIYEMLMYIGGEAT